MKPLNILENNWEHKRNNEEHNASNSCHRIVEDRTNQGTKLGTDSELGNELISSTLQGRIQSLERGEHFVEKVEDQKKKR